MLLHHEPGLSMDASEQENILKWSHLRHSTAALAKLVFNTVHASTYKNVSGSLEHGARAPRE